MKKKYCTVLTIAGSDSGGGAGIQADIKTASALGCYASSVITSVTSQNTVGVQGVIVLDDTVVASQLESVFSDIEIGAVKTGMLPNAAIVGRVVDAVKQYGVRNLVVDPVMVSTSGAQLVDEHAIRIMRAQLMPLSRVITPNISEAELLSGVSITTERDFAAAAAKLLDAGAQAVLLKAGHLAGNLLTDYLFTADGGEYRYANSRVETRNTHGTGCTLSAAIASYLALGSSLPEAVGIAVKYLHGAITAGADFEIGRGYGPVNHFYTLWHHE